MNLCFSRIGSLFVILATCVTIAGAEAEDAAPDPNHHKGVKLTVKGKDGKDVTVQTADGEFLSKGVLTLYLGDEVHVEFQEKDGKLVEPKVVAKVTTPERTITFKLSHSDDMTMLSRTTQIQKAVSMDCAFGAVQQKELGKTILEPTEKGLGQFDSWPGEVFALQLSKIEVSDKSAGEIYKEKAQAR